jgi:hypothetical protein
MERGLGVDAELFDKVVAASPWIAPFLALAVLLRKDFIAFLFAGRGDTAMEALLAKMVAQFEDNLTQFRFLGDQSAKWVDEQKRTTAAVQELMQIQRAILNEMVRGIDRRGG